jgi:hypothetical protein
MLEQSLRQSRDPKQQKRAPTLWIVAPSAPPALAMPGASSLRGALATKQSSLASWPWIASLALAMTN